MIIKMLSISAKLISTVLGLRLSHYGVAIMSCIPIDSNHIKTVVKVRIRYYVLNNKHIYVYV